MGLGEWWVRCMEDWQCQLGSLIHGGLSNSVFSVWDVPDWLNGTGVSSWAFQDPELWSMSVYLWLGTMVARLLSGPFVYKADDRIKVKCGFNNVLRVWSCFLVYNWNFSEWIRVQACLLKTTLHVFDCPWSFTFSYLDLIASTKTVLSVDECRIIVAGGGTNEDVLYDHLVHITPVFFCFKSC